MFARIRLIVGILLLLRARAACICVLLFALAIVVVCLGPVRMMADYQRLVTAADPARLAGLIMLALRAMLFASPMLVISGILCLIAGVLPRAAARPAIGMASA